MSIQQFEDFKNPHLDNEEEKDKLIAIAAAKGAGLALVAGGLIAMSGARYSKTYQTVSRPLKQFLLGTGTFALEREREREREKKKSQKNDSTSTLSQA